MLSFRDAARTKEHVLHALPLPPSPSMPSPPPLLLSPLLPSSGTPPLLWLPSPPLFNFHAGIERLHSYIRRRVLGGLTLLEPQSRFGDK